MPPQRGRKKGKAMEMEQEQEPALAAPRQVRAGLIPPRCFETFYAAILQCVKMSDLYYRLRMIFRRYALRLIFNCSVFPSAGHLLQGD